MSRSVPSPPTIVPASEPAPVIAKVSLPVLPCRLSMLEKAGPPVTLPELEPVTLKTVALLVATSVVVPEPDEPTISATLV